MRTRTDEWFHSESIPLLPPCTGQTAKAQPPQ